MEIAAEECGDESTTKGRFIVLTAGRGMIDDIF
jgi:hypothetical protein